MQNTTMSTMYSDKGIVYLIGGCLLTFVGSVFTKLFAGMAPVLAFITRADITFFLTCVVACITGSAGVIKMSRDWKEGHLKPFWYKWKVYRNWKQKKNNKQRRA